MADSSTFIVIDTTSREVVVSTASVTDAGTGLVVRQAAILGHLADVAEALQRSTSYPILLLGDGYQAISSAGLVKVTAGYFVVTTRPVVGWMSTDRPLRPCRPVVARLLPVGSRVEELLISDNSNPYQADAAEAGMNLLTAFGGPRIVIREGQSDWVRGWQIVPPCPAYSESRRRKVEVGTFEAEFDLRPEHRAKMFELPDLLRALHRVMVRLERDPKVALEAVLHTDGQKWPPLLNNPWIGVGSCKERAAAVAAVLAEAPAPFEELPSGSRSS